MRFLFSQINKNSKFKKISAFIFLFIFLFIAAIHGEAAINKQINYQGKLTNASGVAVTDGTYNIEFKLYTASTGGTAIWTETRIEANKVQITSGIFSVLLGEVNPLTGVNFNQTLYLGVNIGGTGTPGWDGEMSPRKKIGAVPAAIVSEGALNILGGSTGYIPFQTAADATSYSSNFFWDNSNNRLGIGTTNPTEALTVGGNIKINNQILSPDTVTFDAETSTGLRITNPNGYVSITPLNTSGAHIYTNLPRFYFNATPISINGSFSAYSTNDLKLQTGSGGATRMTIQAATGNVGIGLTDPSTPLDVNGVMNSATGFRIGGEAVAGNFLRGNGTNFVSSAIQSSDISDTMVTGKLLTGFISGSGTVTATDSILQAIQKLSGNIAANGNGTVTSVDTAAANNGVTATWTNTTTTPRLTIGLGDITPSSVSTSSIITASGALSITPAAGSNLNINLSTTGDFAVNTNQLYVDTSAGNVGIGITNPNATLHVNGSSIFEGAADFKGSVAINTDPDNNASGFEYGNGYDPTTANYFNERFRVNSFFESPFVSMGVSTNYLLQTEVFDNSSWVKTNIGTVSANGVAAPTGAATAENIPAGTVATANISQTITNNTTGYWSAGVWARAQSGTATISLRIDSSAETGTEKNINLDSQWRFYSVKQNFTSANTTKTFRIISGTNAISLWGARMNPGEVVNAYYVRTTSALTTATPGVFFNNNTIYGSVNGSLSGNATTASSATYSNYGSYGGTSISNATDKTDTWEYIGDIYIAYNSTYRYGSSWNIQLMLNEQSNNDSIVSQQNLDNIELRIKGNLASVADGTTFNAAVPTFSIDLMGDSKLTTNDVAMLVYSSSTSSKSLRIYVKLKNPNTHYSIVPITRYGASYSSTGAISTAYNYFNYAVTQATIAALPGPAQGSIAYGNNAGYLKLDGSNANTNINLGSHDLTIDSNTLFIDSTNHRVGIGTTTPGQKMEINGNLLFSSGADRVISVGSSTDSTGNNLTIKSADTIGDYFGGDISIATGSGAYGYGNASISGRSIKLFSGSVSQTERVIVDSIGNVGIGVTNPTAVLNLKAGGNLIAPLKFTSGSLLTSPEAGAVEFLNDAFYGTITTGAARKQFAFTDSNITGTASGFTGSLSGEVTGTQGATVVSNAAVIGKTLTGYVSGAGTITASDTILSAIQKLSGNIAANGNGTVTSVDTAAANNGVTATWTNTTTTPRLTIGLGDITPSSVSTSSIITASGALSITPAAGSNLNINLSTTGDFAVNTNQLYVDTSSGNVGIGTTNPSLAKFQIEAGNGVIGQYISGGTTVGTDLLKLRANAATQRLILEGAGGTVQTFLEAGGSIGLFGTVTNHDFRIRTNYVDRMTFDTAGNVGIGTTAPLAELDTNGKALVRQTLTVADTSVVKAYSSFGTNSTTHGLSAASDVLFSGNVEIDGQLYLDNAVINSGTFNTTGDFQVDGVMKLSDGTAANPSYTFTNDLDTGLFRPGTNILGLTTGGAERMRIDSNGRIGIGMTAPEGLLNIKTSIDSNSDTATYNLAETIGSGSATGLQTIAYGTETSTGDLFSMVAITGGAGNATKATGLYVGTSNTGTINANYGVLIASGYNTGTIETNIGLFIDDQSGLGSIESYQVFSNTGDYPFAITSTGNVGIGVSMPAISLDVKGKDAIDYTDAPVAFQVTGGTGASYFLGGPGAPGKKGGNIILSGGSGGSGDAIMSDAGGGGDIIFNGGPAGPNPLSGMPPRSGNIILSNLRGNVGIGTSDPQTKLDVTGIIRSTETDSSYSQFVHADAASDPSYPRSLFQIYGSAVENVGFYISPGNATGTTQLPAFMGVSTNANVTQMGSVQFVNSVSTSSASIFTLSAEGSYRAVPIYFGDPTTPDLAITTTGNVGIGTTNPSSKLEISGSSAALTLTNTGTTNQSWQFISGLGGAGDTSFSIRDKTADKTRLHIDQYGQVMIGTSTNVLSNGSRLFVYGGANGANVDAMGDSSVLYGDQSVFEAEGADYGDPYQHSIAIRYFGSGAFPMTFAGLSNINMGMLDFGEANAALITTSNTTPIVFAVNDTEGMRLTTNGLGVGTTNPTAKLQVAGGLRFEGIQTIDTLNGTDDLNINPQANLYLGTANTDGLFLGRTDSNIITTVRGILKVVAASGTQGLYQNTTGNVGIGTTAPSNFKLQVAGDIGPNANDSYSLGSVTNQWYRVYAGTGGINSYGGITQTGSGNNSFTGNIGIGTTAPGAKLEVSGGGNILIDNNYAYQSRLADGSVKNLLKIGNDNFTYLRSVATDKGIIFGDTTGFALMTILNGGNVGIGTTTPNRVLNILGGSTSTETTLLELRSNGTGANTATTLKFTESGTSGSTVGSEITSIRTDAINSGDSDLLFRNTLALVQTERMRITSAGNVGIGTTNPGARLDVIGSGGINVNTNGNGNEITLTRSGTANNLVGKFTIQTPSSNQQLNIDVTDGAGTAKPLVMQTSGGNVGIGTTSPNSRLEISYPNQALTGSYDTGNNSLAKVHLGLVTTDTQAADVGAGLGLGGLYNTGGTRILFGAISGKKTNGTSANTAGYLAFYTNLNGTGLTEKMRILDSGNVGIGTTSPAYPLTVNGSMQMTSGGYIYGDTTTPFLRLSNSSGTFLNYGTNSIYLSSADIRLLPSGTQTAIVTTAGVGIGTTAPGRKLDVAGDIYASAAQSGNPTTGAGVRILGGAAPAIYGYDYGNTLWLDLPIYAKNISLMPQSNGNVGIGTTAPTNILSFANSQAQKIWIENTASDVSGKALTLSAGSTVAGTSLSDRSGGNLVLQSGLGTGSGSSTISFNTGTTGASGMTLQSYSTKMTILGNGNIGIGTTAPVTIVDINKSTNSGAIGTLPTINIKNTLATQGDGVSTYNFSAYQFSAGNGTVSGQFLASYNSDAVYGNEIQFRTVTDHNMSFWTNSQRRMTILNSGNVGIGTSTPAATVPQGFVSTSPSQSLQISTGGASYDAGLFLRRSDNAVGLDLWSDGSNGGAYIDSRYNHDTTGNIYFRTKSSTATPLTTLTILGNGNVGIGTTNPVYKLEIDNGGLYFGSYDTGSSNVSGIVLARNNNTSTPSAGWINFLNRSGTNGYVWQDSAGNMRINNAVPTSASDTDGTIIGAQTSTRDTKQDINDYTNYASALKMVIDAPLHTFRYKKEVEGYGTDSPLAKIRLGYIADEVNPMFMVGNSIDQVSVNGLLIASIKELNLQISNLSKGQIVSPTDSFGQYASLFFSDILTKVENGVAYMKALAVETLKVGSPDKRTGITFYDEVTGNPYCFSIANGATKTMLGECTVISPAPETNVVYAPTNPDVPVITLDGDVLVSLDVGGTYTEMGAIAKDNADGEVPVVISGSVDTTTPGTYTITYSATNKAGTTATATRTVNVGTTEPITTETTATPAQSGSGTTTSETPASSSTTSTETIVPDQTTETATS